MAGGRLKVVVYPVSYSANFAPARLIIMVGIRKEL